jgi:hypothetical protein
MIYLEETYDMNPATPVVRDQFIALAAEEIIPAYTEYGARLVAAWTCNAVRWGQITQMLEFDNFTAYDHYCDALANSQSWSDTYKKLETLAPERQHRLLESLVPNFVPVLQKAIQDSADTPLQQYMLATLEVAPGMMDMMRQGLSEVADSGSLPIAMSWRVLSGKQNTVIDLWKSSLQRTGFQTQADFSAGGIDADWFANLRILAPEEKIFFVDPLPYSPLA